MRLFRITCWTAVFFAVCSGLSSPVRAESKKKIRVEHIIFKGNSVFGESKLSEVMVTRSSRFLRPRYYHEENLSEDLKSLELFYHQHGYLEAAIIDYKVETDSTTYKATIRITLSEGEQTQIEGVSILGNIVFSDSLLADKTSIRAGQPYRQKRIDDSTEALLVYYAEYGYLDTEVTPDIRVDTETHRALIDYYISEKSQYRIDDIQIQGLEKTRETIVMRELLFRPNEVINYSHLLTSQRNIYLTGLFQSVFIRPHAPSGGDSTKKDIQVIVKESMTGEFNVAGGYGLVDKVRGKIEIFNNNVRGTALKLGLTGNVSFVQNSVESSFTDPWTFGKPLRTDINLLVEKKVEPGYNLARIGGKITMGRMFRKNNLTATYRHEQGKLSNIKGTDIPEKLTSNTRSIKLAFSHDTRDNLFNSSRGLFFEASTEAGAYVTSQTRLFYRYNTMIKYFYPIGQKTVIATSAELGLFDAEGGLDAIPLYDRLYAGGPNVLRGFSYEKVGPLDKKRVPVGGKLKFVWNLCEIRRILYKMVGGVVFIDIGNVWTNPRDVSIQDLRVSPGLGLRINTPIGQGRLDYGFNIDRQAHESPSQVYFSMGQAF